MNSPIASIDLGTNSLNTLVVLVSNNKIKNIEENLKTLFYIINIIFSITL